VQLFASIIVTPPAKLPEPLARELAAAETRWARDRSRRAIAPFLCFFLITPVIPFITIGSWPTLIALYASVVGMLATAYVNWRVREVPVAVYVSVQLVVVLLFSRLTSPFVLAPGVIAGMLLAVTAMPWLCDRAWAVATWALAAAGLPFILEGIGALAPTFDMTSRGILLEGSIFETRTTVDAVALGAASIAITLLVALYALAIARDRRAAQRSLYVQAWHLRQLLPGVHHPG